MSWSELTVPLLLFVGGALYVALDTVRILFVGKGLRKLGGLIGCVEVVVFLLAVSKVLSGPLSVLNIMAYAAGFGFGTWLGGVIDEEVAVGHVLVRVIAQHDARRLLDALAKAGYGVTNVAARGHFGRYRVVFSVLKRRNIAHFLGLVDQYNPNAFVSVEDVRSVREARHNFDAFMESA